MADNTTLNTGSGGDTIATDDCAGVKYQLVKLVDGTADSTTVIPGSNNGLRVDPSNVTSPVSLATVPSHPVTNAGTFAVQESGSQVQTDDAAFTPATSKVLMVGAEFDDTSPDSVDEGDGGAVRMSANRNLYVRIRDNAGNERGLNIDGNGEIQISGSRNAVAVTDNAGSLTVDNGGTFAVQAAQSGTWTVQPGNTANTTAWKVDASSVAVPVTDNAGSLTVDQATASSLKCEPAGNVAHDAGDSGNPVKVGAKAIASLKTTTLVSGADRTDNQSDLDGALLVRQQFPLGDLISEAVSNTDGSSTAFSNFGAVASTKNYITGITAFRTDTGTTMAYVDLRDGTGGSVLWRVPLPPNGGSVQISALPLFKTSANTALAFDVSSALNTVYINVTGFQSKVS